MKWSLMPFYLDCQIVDLEEMFDFSHSTLQLIAFNFNPTDSKTALNIHLVEKESRSFRPIKSFSHQFRGLPITLENLKKPRVVKFDFKLEKTIHSDRDCKQPCVNYPTQEFKTFGECDKQFVREQYKRKYRGNPIWLADSPAEVTNKRYFHHFLKGTNF